MATECSDLLNERRLIEEKIWALRARLAAIQGLAQHGLENVAAAFFWFHEIEKDRSAIPPYVRRAWEEVTVGSPGKQRVHGVQSGRFDAGLDLEDDEAFADWNDEAADEFPEESSGGSDSEPGERERLPGTKVCIERSRCCFIRIWPAR